MRSLKSSRPRSAWRSVLTGGVTALLGLLGGCASGPAPVEQIKYFKDALGAVNTVQQPFLDEMAIAERSQGQAIAASNSGKSNKDTPSSGTACRDDPNVTPQWQGTSSVGIADNLCLADAIYYVSDTDPPATASFRRSLRVVGEYADLMLALAEGRGAEQAVADATALAAEVDGILVIAKASAPSIAAALTALQPSLALIAKAKSKQDAIDSILANSQKVTDLIASLKKALPKMFKQR